MNDSWHSSHAMESHIGRLEAELRRAHRIIRKLANLAEKHGHKERKVGRDGGDNQRNRTPSLELPSGN